MNHKTISTPSANLLSYFNKQNKSWFDFPEALEALPQTSEGALRELLSDMTKRGLLMRLKRGLYYIIPYEQNAKTFMPDWHVVAGILVNDKDHYIGYYSAMQIHDLITQPSLKEQIVVANQIRPSIIHIKGVPFQFIFHNEKHFFGAKKIWVDKYHKVFCSDVEKTIIDCLFKPEYAGGIVEIAKAIHLSRKNLNYDKLLDYIRRFDSQAVVKRLGFLLEILEINTGLIEELQKIKSTSYVLLDTELPDIGKRSNRWRIRENLDSETIKSAIYT